MPSGVEKSAQTVLLVEDSAALVAAMKPALESGGFNVAVMDDGLKAEHYIGTHEPADLVVLDIMLPHRDGYQLLEQIRRSPRWNLVKVIMLSARDQSQDVKRARRAGADDYLFKPLEPKNLLQHVVRLLTAP